MSAALQKAKRVDTIPTTPETFIERIRETYPFHPSIRDIVARFAENRGYQKTRALIRLLRLAVRGALAANDNAFLIGLQHLDFNDQGTLEEIRKINPAYANAISRDVADRGNALAEKIDAADGNSDRVGGRQGAADVVAVGGGVAAARAHRWRADRDARRSAARSLGDQGGTRPPARAGLVSLPGRRSSRLLRADGERHGRDHRDRREHRRGAGRPDAARPSCRRCSSRAPERSIPTAWRSCRRSTKSSSTTTARRSSSWSGPPTSSRRISSTGGTSRTCRTACLCSRPIRMRSRRCAPARGACAPSTRSRSGSRRSTARSRRR